MVQVTVGGPLAALTRAAAACMHMRAGEGCCKYARRWSRRMCSVRGPNGWGGVGVTPPLMTLQQTGLQLARSWALCSRRVAVADDGIKG